MIDDNTEFGRKFADRMESASRIMAALTLAAREPGVPVKEDHFDRDQNILRCANVAINLATGEEIKLTPEMLVSKSLAVPYNRDAQCPLFMKFMNEITSGRVEIVEFLRRWFGLCLSGDMGHQSFAIFYGSGANGKSTLTETISRIMGTYAKMAPAETFTVKSMGPGIPNDIAGLRGARLVLATETEQNARLAESKIKTLTGGDKVSARFMRGEFFEFTPTWKIIISTNHKPRIFGGDHGIWRRIILIPFDFTCPVDKIDPELPSKLWEEREGILAWMIGGARDYFTDGGGRRSLAVPAVAIEATEEYRTDEDVIGRFITEACVVGEEQLVSLALPKRVAAGLLLKSFQVWCEANNEIGAGRTSAVQFGKSLRDRGFEPTRGDHGARSYAGICPTNILELSSNDYQEKGARYGD
jgi:putative DNA primase/helicase